MRRSWQLQVSQGLRTGVSGGSKVEFVMMIDSSYEAGADNLPADDERTTVE